MDVEEQQMEHHRQNMADQGTMSTKQRHTRDSVKKTGEDMDMKTLEESIRTYITHNKGGKWDLIRAPEYDVDGNPSRCYIEEGCSLHLQIYSSNGIFPPPYSQDSAIGIIMAVGNIGRQLEKNKPDRMNTYLSRDGGLTWQEVMKGSHIYEIGDHGGLIAMAKNMEKTSEILYTFNEGNTWHTMTISDSAIDVTNIIIEPLSVASEFVVYG